MTYQSNAKGHVVTQIAHFVRARGGCVRFWSKYGSFVTQWMLEESMLSLALSVFGTYELYEKASQSDLMELNYCHFFMRFRVWKWSCWVPHSGRSLGLLRRLIHHCGHENPMETRVRKFYISILSWLALMPRYRWHKNVSLLRNQNFRCVE